MIVTSKKAILWLLVIFFIAFLIAIAAYDPLRVAVGNALAGAGGSTYAALASTWAGISSNPIYQQYHVFIWLVGGLFLAFAVHQLHNANKIPLFHVKTASSGPAPMGAPSTVIIREVPATTKTQPEPAPAEQEQAAEAK